MEKLLLTSTLSSHYPICQVSIEFIYIYHSIFHKVNIIKHKKQLKSIVMSSSNERTESDEDYNTRKLLKSIKKLKNQLASTKTKKNHGDSKESRKNQRCCSHCSKSRSRSRSPSTRPKADEAASALFKWWEEVLLADIPPSLIAAITEKYPPIISALGTIPKLNPEISCAASESALQRDDHIALKQAYLSASLGALGHVLRSLDERGPLGGADAQIVAIVGDVGRLLAHFYRQETQLRRTLLGRTGGLSAKFKEAMADVPADEWLFGRHLGGRLALNKMIRRELYVQPTTSRARSTRHRARGAKGRDLAGPSEGFTVERSPAGTTGDTQLFWNGK